MGKPQSVRPMEGMPQTAKAETVSGRVSDYHVPKCSEQVERTPGWVYGCVTREVLRKSWFPREEKLGG